MSFSELVAELTRDAVDEIMRYARAVPPDKLHWRPAEHARSVIEILQECALTPLTLDLLLRTRPQGEITDMQPFNAIQAQAAQLTTLDAIEHALRTNTEQFLHAVQDLPMELLEQTVATPWGKPYPLKELALGHYWNLTYHLGQIAYIQLLYGDTNYY
ncbi:MAG: hypothetical protein RMK45_04145 [Armatimonadota bacterium]|nr:hypothetical protein [Armatimonadota bacterium]